MNTTTRPRTAGDARWLTAEDHILRITHTTPNEQIEEHELARRAIHRIAGDNAPELIDILGLAIPEPAAADTVPANRKRCARCQEPKPRSDYYKRLETRDGLYSICKPCHNSARKPSPRGRQDHIKPGGRGLSFTRDAINERINTYRDLIGAGRTQREAAEQMGIGLRTASSYHTKLRQRGEL